MTTRNAGGPAGLDRLGNIVAHRVEKADEADQMQVAVGLRPVVGDMLHRQRQQTQTVLCGLGVAVEPALPCFVVERLCPAAAGQDLGADVEHRLGRALDRHEVAITILVHGGHHL